MSRKEFVAAAQEMAGESVEVDLGDGDVFAVPTPLPGLAILDLAVAAQEGGTQSVAAMTQFLAAAMGTETYAKFHDKAMEKRVSMDMLGEIMRYVVEEATGRPMEQPSEWQPPQLNGGESSPIAASN